MLKCKQQILVLRNSRVLAIKLTRKTYTSVTLTFPQISAVLCSHDHKQIMYSKRKESFIA